LWQPTRSAVVELLPLGNLERLPDLALDSLDLLQPALLALALLPRLEPDLLHLLYEFHPDDEQARDLARALPEMDRQRIYGEAGAALRAVLEAEESCDQRVLLLDDRRVLIPEVDRDQVPINFRVVAPAREDADHVLLAVERLPRLFVGGGPLLRAHARVMDRRVEGIPLVEIGIHPFAALLHLFVVLRARQRREHEEGGLIGPDCVHEILDVALDTGAVVPREPDDVAGVDDDAGVVPLLDDALILLDFVLRLALGLQVVRVDALHPDEDLRAAGLGGERDEVLRLLRQIDLHHERDFDAFLAQLDNLEEGLAPELFSREIVVGEKVKSHAVLEIVGAQERGDALRATLAHLAPLHVDDRAERAGERAAARGVGGAERRLREVLHRFRAGHGKRRLADVDEILQVLRVVVQRLQLAF